MAVVVYFPSRLGEGFFTDLPAPTAGDDARAITYDHDTGAFVYASGGVTDHALLSSLDFASAGHTGFEASGTAAAAISTHVGEADPHTQYALESALGTMATATETNYLKADGSRTGATSQAQAFTNGINSADRIVIEDSSAFANHTTIENAVDTQTGSGVHATYISGTDRIFIGSPTSAAYRLELLYCTSIGNPPTMDWSGSKVMIANGGVSLFARSGNDILIHGGTFFQRLLFNAQNTSTNTIANCYHFRSFNSGTPTAGFGVGFRAGLKSSTTTDQDAGRLTWEWDRDNVNSATHATRSARVRLSANYTSTESVIIDGIVDSSGPRVAFLGGTPVAKAAAYTQTFATASRTMSAYTADDESAAYTGVDNTQVGSVYATVADLNALRVAVENLRASHENRQQVLNSVIDDVQAVNLVG